jgi:hypothetical protein
MPTFAYDSNALTMDEMAMLAKDPVTQKMVAGIYSTNSMLKDIPLRTNPSMRMRGSRYLGSDLPGITYRAIGQIPGFKKTKGEQFEEQAYLVSDFFEIEQRLLDMNEYREDPMEDQFNRWKSAFQYDLNDKLINNTPELNDLAPIGFKFRTDNPIDASLASEIKLNGGGIDLHVPNITQDTANEFMALLEQLVDYTEGDKKVLYMNDYMMRSMNAAVRKLGAAAGWKTNDTNLYDKRVTTYDGLTIRSVGRKADQVSRVIPINETVLGEPGIGTDNKSSIYCVGYGSSGLYGWQTNEMDVKDLGLSRENGLIHRWLVDWGFGLMQPHPRAITRLFNVKVKA